MFPKAGSLVVAMQKFPLILQLFDVKSKKEFLD
jgi:hypothetical protein